MVDAAGVKGLTCPSCGAAITLRAGQLALVVVCASCHAVLDAKDPNLAVLQKFERKLNYKPSIPLGTRGNIKGDAYEVIGYQVRAVTVEHVDYEWSEYLLWNPYKGFRYLAEYHGHWNDISVTKSPPEESTFNGRPVVTFHGETFKHFQTSSATTKFILGEFPWQVKVGDRAHIRDFVSPPHMLSEETTNDETTWSVGTYTSPQRIWEEFSLQGTPPVPQGVFENQPDDYVTGAKQLTALFALFAVVVLLFMVVRFGGSTPPTIFNQSFTFTPPGSDSTAFVTKEFPITGRTSNVEVAIDASLTNSWVYFNLALINQETGRALDFGREVSYYTGSDEDGFWSEGGTSDRSYLPSVPAGTYFLRVQPEGPAGDARTIGYTIKLRRDVPRTTFFLIALGLLAAVPLIALARMAAFESMRWKESDYAPSSSSSSGDDDE
ncbi:MAG: DUF4178 domain-containing protein [Gemmatimonadales bacterium]